MRIDEPNAQGPAALSGTQDAGGRAISLGSEEVMRLLVDSVRDYAIFMLDPAGLVVTWNAGAERIKGYRTEEILGQSFACFYPPEDAAAGKPQRLLQEAVRYGRTEDEGWRVRKDGTRFWASAVLSAIRDTNGALLGFAKVTRDLTERKRAEDALTRLNADLASFSYSVSHDLRAPLRAIDGYAGALFEDHAALLDAEARRLLTAVRDNAQRLDRLIDALLALANLGRQALHPEPVDMTALARSVLDELLPAGAAVQVTLESLPHAFGDKVLLREVLANLVGNALKFSRARPHPRVEIGGRLQGDETVYVVRDNGVGFDMRYASKLFQVFSRLHGADEFEGTGVGLALVERIVSRHGGRVWAEAAPDRGAAFYFTLPQEPL